MGVLDRDPTPPPATAPTEGRALQASLQLPREARWSRPSSIILSVLVHIALFVALRHLIWKPIVKQGPVFNLFQLTQAPPEPKPLPPLPVIETPSDPPPVAQTQPKDERDVTTPPPADAAPPLVEPMNVPDFIPPPGAAVTVPSGNQPLTAAERLLRTGISPQLRPAPFSSNAMTREPTPQEAASMRLAEGMKAYNDSVAGAADAARRTTDWTKTDRNGGRWGLAPDGIHIGSVTIPLPNFSFAPPPGKRDEIGAKVRAYAESNAQAKRMELEETFESRVKAMRARKDAQRDSAKVGRMGGGN